MKTIKVNLKKRSYEIVVGSGILKRLPKFIHRLKLGTSAYVITNAAVKSRYGAALSKILKGFGLEVRIKLIPDTEKSKSIITATLIINDLTRFDRKKKVFIVAFGGGVAGDLAGFVASIYKRGIPYIQLPTTLLAQVDSSIGGKTAVDLTLGKNLVGTFYQPRLVFSDVKLLESLALRQIRSGLAEVIKYGVIKDTALFSYLEKNSKGILASNPRALEFIVQRCSLIKAGIIQQDEREEKGIRTILNFGHTIGHAIEAAGNYKKYNHGEAIALGMIAATNISVRLGLLKASSAKKIYSLIQRFGLPVKIKAIALGDIINSHYLDKKFSGSRNRFVLIRDIGKTKIFRGVPLKVIRGALLDMY